MDTLFELSLLISLKLWDQLGDMNGQTSFLLGALLCFMVMRYLIRLGIIVVLVVISLALAGTPIGFAALAQQFPDIAQWIGDDIVEILEKNELADSTIDSITEKAQKLIDSQLGEEETPPGALEEEQAESEEEQEAGPSARRSSVKKLK